jgi:hypothetical protein
MLDPLTEPWMVPVFILMMAGYVKLCIYLENENNDKTDKG